MRHDLPKLSIGEAFDEAFDLYKRNFSLLALTAAILYVPARIILAGALLSARADKFSGGVNPTSADMERLVGFMGVLLLATMAFYALVAALSGAITVAVSERYLERPVTAGQAYGAMLRALPRLLTAWVLIGAIIMVSAIVLLFVLSIMVGLIAASVGASGLGDEWVGLAIGIAYLVGFLFLSAGVFVWLGVFITPVIMLEKAGPITALQRNVELVRGRWARLTLGLIGLFTVVAVLQSVTVIFVQLGLQLFIYSWIHTSELVQRVTEASLGSIVSLFVHPLWMTTLTVLYYDQRVRREGFDMALMLVHLDARRAAALAETAERAV